MFIDVVNSGWVPIDNVNVCEDVIRNMVNPAIALDEPLDPTSTAGSPAGWWSTHDDVAVHD